MAAISFKVFRGTVPRRSERLLSPNYAQQATNCKITSGALDPLSGPQLASIIGREIATMYRYRYFLNGEPVDNWLTFPYDADICLSPLSNDERGRVYFTSESHEPRYTSAALALTTPPYPTAHRPLGIFNPETAPGWGYGPGDTNGGSGATETRFYAVTYVLATGEESGPSPASAARTDFINGSWAVLIRDVPLRLNGGQNDGGTSDLSAFTSVGSGKYSITIKQPYGIRAGDVLVFSNITYVATSGNRDLAGAHRVLEASKSGADTVVTIELPFPQETPTFDATTTWERESKYDIAGMKRRIYRSVGTSGNFAFVAEIDAFSISYADSIASTLVTDPIETLETLPPPGTMHSMISLPNGCLAGIAGNEVCFSHPYRNYDWPLKNRYSFSGVGIALVPAGTSVMLLTDGFPILFTGTDPEAMSPSVMETYAPCVSKRGVSNVGGGALYPSYDGLYLIAPGVANNITRSLYREDEWRAINPETFNATFHGGQYYATHDHPLGQRIFVLDVGEPDSSLEVLQDATELYSNNYDGRLYLAKGGNIYLFDEDEENTYMADWVSPDVQIGKPTNFSWAQIHADFDDIVPVDSSNDDRNRALMALGADAVGGDMLSFEFLGFEISGDNLIQPRPVTEKKVQFTLYKHGAPVFTKDVTSTKPFRLPAGYKAEVQSVGVSGSVRIHSVTVAESTAELQGAS